MELHNLKPAHGSVKTSHNRKGRGEATGNGGTAGRGHKGAKSRSGYSKKVGFEGGQMPLQRRVPKFGFTNPNRVEYKGVNLDTLQVLVDDGRITDSVDHATLVALGVIKPNDLVKILGRGELNTRINVTAHKFTKTAKDSIESKGGKAITL